MTRVTVLLLFLEDLQFSVSLGVVDQFEVPVFALDILLNGVWTSISCNLYLLFITIEPSSR